MAQRVVATELLFAKVIDPPEISVGQVNCTLRKQIQNRVWQIASAISDSINRLRIDFLFHPWRLSAAGNQLRLCPLPITSGRRGTTTTNRPCPRRDLSIAMSMQIL